MKPKQSQGTDYPIQPAGTHLAVLFQLIDMGTQTITFEGQEKNVPQLRFVWELHGDEAAMPDGKPMAISKTFTNSSHEKGTLRKFIQQWRSKAFSDAEFADFDLRDMLGKACLLTITHTDKDGKTYANIASITKLVAGMESPAPVNEALYVSLDRDEYVAADFNKLGQKLKDKIYDSPEYKALLEAHNDIPFEQK